MLKQDWKFAGLSLNVTLAELMIRSNIVMGQCDVNVTHRKKDPTDVWARDGNSDGLMKVPGPAEDFDWLGLVISISHMLQLNDNFNFEMMKSCFCMRFEGKCQLRWRSVPVSAVQGSWYQNYVTMEWQMCSIQSQLDIFFYLFLSDDALWVWFEVPEIAKKSLLQAEVTLHKVGHRIFISWWQQWAVSMADGNSWSVHFKHTSILIATLTGYENVENDHRIDIKREISVMILYYWNLNDQENCHDLKCLSSSFSLNLFFFWPLEKAGSWIVPSRNSGYTSISVKCYRIYS